MVREGNLNQFSLSQIKILKKKKNYDTFDKFDSSDNTQKGA